MKRHYVLPSVAVGVVACALWAQPLGPRLLAQSTPPVALQGHVSSADERAMEGVIVTAKRAGATIATSVVTQRARRLPVSGRAPGAGLILAADSRRGLRPVRCRHGDDRVWPHGRFGPHTRKDQKSRRRN